VAAQHAGIRASDAPGSARRQPKRLDPLASRETGALAAAIPRTASASDIHKARPRSVAVMVWTAFPSRMCLLSRGAARS
jgi:hypothetical protein